MTSMMSESAVDGGLVHFADDFEDFFGAGLDVADLDGAAEEDHVFGDGGGIDDGGIVEAGFEVLDAGFEHGEFFAGGVVVGVFLEVAFFAGLARWRGRCAGAGRSWP